MHDNVNDMALLEGQRVGHSRVGPCHLLARTEGGNEHASLTSEHWLAGVRKVAAEDYRRAWRWLKHDLWVLLG